MTEENYLKAIAVKEHISDMNNILISLRNGTFTFSCPGYDHDSICGLLYTTEATKSLIKHCETKISDLENEFKRI